MKNLKDILIEGFYNNVGASIEKTIDDWWSNFGDYWYPYVTSYDEKQARRLSIRYNPEKRCVYIHDDKYKTERMDIELDLIKEWENCFSHLYQDTINSGERDIQFMLFPNDSSWSNSDELWISVRLHSGRDRNHYIYNINKKTHRAIFKKADLK